MTYHPKEYQRTKTEWRTGDIPDARWPTDNDYDIPLLNSHLQANALDQPFVQWGTQSRKRRMTGTWGFYVDDYRFNGLWTDPTGVMNSGCVSAIEPNFTITDQTPTALAIYRTYQKRWLARTWQELAGIRIFVDLNVPNQFRALNLLGVPRGWRAYATRAYADRLEQTMYEYVTACEHAGHDDLLFVVYGGGMPARDYCLDHGLIWYGDQQSIATHKIHPLL